MSYPWRHKWYHTSIDSDILWHIATCRTCRLTWHMSAYLKMTHFDMSRHVLWHVDDMSRHGATYRDVGRWADMSFADMWRVDLRTESMIRCCAMLPPIAFARPVLCCENMIRRLETSPSSSSPATAAPCRQRQTLLTTSSPLLPDFFVATAGNWPLVCRNFRKTHLDGINRTRAPRLHAPTRWGVVQSNRSLDGWKTREIDATNRTREWKRKLKASRNQQKRKQRWTPFSASMRWRCNQQSTTSADRGSRIIWHVNTWGGKWW